MTDQQPDTPATKAELNQQTATVAWNELIKHFARGVVIYVDNNLDLIDVAHHVTADNVKYIEACLADGSLRRATDDDAKDWNLRTPDFWCVVAAPWVLIQERIYSEDVH